MAIQNANYIIHNARPGQRWDNLSSLYYNDDFGYKPIVNENPQYLNVISFEGGEVIRIPAQNITTETTTNPGLPPWKRQTNA